MKSSRAQRQPRKPGSQRPWPPPCHQPKQPSHPCGVQGHPLLELQPKAEGSAISLPASLSSTFPQTLLQTGTCRPTTTPDPAQDTLPGPLWVWAAPSLPRSEPLLELAVQGRYCWGVCRCCYFSLRTKPTVSSTTLAGSSLAHLSHLPTLAAALHATPRHSLPAPLPGGCAMAPARNGTAAALTSLPRSCQEPWGPVLAGGTLVRVPRRYTWVRESNRRSSGGPTRGLGAGSLLDAHAALQAPRPPSRKGWRLGVPTTSRPTLPELAWHLFMPPK